MNKKTASQVSGQKSLFSFFSKAPVAAASKAADKEKEVKGKDDDRDDRMEVEDGETLILGKHERSDCLNVWCTIVFKFVFKISNSLS